MKSNTKPNSQYYVESAIHDMIMSTCASGETSCIAKMLAHTPNMQIIVMHKTKNIANETRLAYVKELDIIYRARPWYKKLYDSIYRSMFGHQYNEKYPLFLSFSDNIRGLKLPVIFDSSCFI